MDKKEYRKKVMERLSDRARALAHEDAAAVKEQMAGDTPFIRPALCSTQIRALAEYIADEFHDVKSRINELADPRYVPIPIRPPNGGPPKENK